MVKENRCLKKPNRGRTMRNLVTVMCMATLTIGLLACGTPSKRVMQRDKEIRQARSALNAGENEAMAQLVSKAESKSNATGEFDDFVDYYYIKSVSTRLLYGNILDLLTRGKLEQARSILIEALKISPDHHGLLKIAGQLDVSNLPPYLLNDLAPSSRTAQTINRMFDRRMLYARGWRFKASRPLDDFSSDEMTPFAKYYEALIEPVSMSQYPLKIQAADHAYHPSQEGGRAELRLDHFFDFLIKVQKLPVTIHRSARAKTSKFSLDGFLNRQVSPHELLAALTRDSGLNVVAGPFGLVLFSGDALPSDLDHGRNRFMIKVEYQSVASVSNGLRSMGFAPNIVGVDEATSLIYFRGQLGEYLRALEYVASLDSAPAEVLLNVEIVEIEQSLLHAIGIGVPQKIDINFSDPIYRRYSFTDAFGQDIKAVENNGIIVNHNKTGSVGLTNLFEQSTKDVLRAVVRDPAFSLAAREKNYELSIIERPSIRLRSGQEGTIDVGSRIPVIAATASSSGFVSEQVTYVNSGIEINADARVTQDGKIRLNMNITTSNLVKLVASPSGSSAPQLSSREIKTTLTIRDGETALIGGISSFKNASDQDGIPGLAQSKYTTPFGGRLSGDQVRNELLMFVTPELITETQIASRSLMGISGGKDAPAYGGAPSSAPMIHRGPSSSSPSSSSSSSVSETPNSRPNTSRR